MITPSLPKDEKKRLETLHELQLLDTDSEERFDRLTRLTKKLFDVPIVLISLIDKNRQWFKSRQGIETCETSRDISFCGHAILGDDIFEITDASKDPRFADNPLVTQAPHIRFYAGMPLKTNKGYRIGTVCLIDSQPRQLDTEECQILRDISHAVVAEIDRSELYKKSRELIQAQAISKTIIQIQTEFINKSNRRYIFDKILADIQNLTGGEYGFLDEVLHTAEGIPFLKSHKNLSKTVWSNEPPVLYRDSDGQEIKFSNLVPLIDAAMNSGKVMLSNDPYKDACSGGGLSKDHSRLHTFLCIPIHHNNTLVAMLGLTNSIDGYDQSIIDLLSPLLATIAQLIMVRRQQEQHRKEQLLLSRIANETTNAVVITDTVGRIKWVNDGFSRITGYTFNEVVGHKPGDILQGPDTDPVTIAKMRYALSRGEGFTVDVVNYTRENQPYWMYVQCNPLRDETGSLEGFMAIESDITSQKKATDALQISESRLRGLFELSPFGIALHDPQINKFIDINTALLKQTGYTRDEFFGMSYLDLLTPPHKQQEKQLMGHQKENEYFGPYEKEFIRKDGTHYPVMIRGVRVHDKNDHTLNWFMIEDISERKRIERMKDEFISTVSHELRTPLTAIKGSLALILEDATGKIPHKMREMLNITRNNSQQLEVLVNDLLDMEQLATGKMTIELQPQSLRPLLEKAVQDNQAYADRFDVYLRLLHGAEDTLVSVDAQRFQQIMANLLSNAAKFSPIGQEVTILTTIHKNNLRVSIRDHGPGIPEAFRESIFHKFSQADSSDSRQKAGSGLGLALTKKLVEQMGGNIYFDSIIGQGTTFHFEFIISGADDSL